jgi:hypothetical protein
MGLSSASESRYRTASIFSAHLVDILKKENSTIQTIAPGPPVNTAAATPTMLPVPKVAARSVHRAE